MATASRRGQDQKSYVGPANISQREGAPTILHRKRVTEDDEIDRNGGCDQIEGRQMRRRPYPSAGAFQDPPPDFEQLSVAPV